MALEPLTVGLMALAGYGLYSHGQRHGRRVRRTGTTRPSIPTPPTLIPKTPLAIAEDCGSWEMPDAWILQTAQTRFRSAIDDALATTKGDVSDAKVRGLLDPIALTYAVLDQEIGACPVPWVHQDDGTTRTFRELQVDDPDRPDYYPHPAILGLFDTIYEAVEAALSVLEQTQNPSYALLFPV